MSSPIGEIEVLRTTFLANGELTTLDSAIALTFSLLASAAPADELPLVHLLTSLLDLCYETTGRATDLLNAIQVLEDAIAATPIDDPRRAGMLHNLGVYHADNFTRTGDTADIAKAVQAAEQAVAATHAGHLHRAVMCTSLATYLSKTCDLPGPHGLADLDRTIWACEAAVAATPLDNPLRGVLLSNLGGYLSNRFARVGNLADMDQAIEVGQEAVAVIPEGHPHRPTMLGNLSTYLSNRFDRTGDTADLTAAIAHREQALAGTAVDDPSRAVGLTKLAYRLNCRFERSGAAEDLENAVRAIEEAVAATPPEHPERATRLGSLACYLTMRSNQKGGDHDLDRAVEASTAAAAATAPGHVQRVTMLNNLGSVLSTRFERLGGTADIDAAITAGEQAAAETSPTHALRAQVLNNLSSYYTTRFNLLGALEDIQNAVSASETALAATPPGHHLRAHMMHSLSSCLLKRFQRLGDLHDLESALVILHDALAIPGSSDAHLRPRMLQSLSIAYKRRYTRLGGIDDLEAAVSASQDAVAETASSHPDHARILETLGNCLHTRYEALSQLSDLQAAISTSETAIAATRDSADRGVRLSNLSCSLAQRFERLGDLSDIDRAVQMSAAALSSLQPDDLRRASFLGHLANQLNLRFNRLGTLEDVEGAIDAAREALAATADNHPDRASRCSNLACYLASRFERVGELQDLDAAIELTVAAVAATPLDHPHRVSMVSNLGNRWQRRFQARKGHEDALQHLDRAIEAASEALAATPLLHNDRAGRLNNLGNGYLSRFEALGERVDLERAVEACTEAVGESPEDHPEFGFRLLLLATSLHLRSRLARPNPNSTDHLDGDFDSALHNALKAWNCDISPPRFRISAARLAAALLTTCGRWSEVSSILGAAVKLLPNVSPQFLRREDQEHMLADFTQLASDAVSAALQAGETAAHCLSLLELGRGIIMGFAIDCRSDLSELKRIDLAAWTSFSQLRTEIDSPLEGTDENTRRRRVEAVREFNDTVCAIRRLPGLETFQLPPSAAELIAIAAGGSTIVVFNSTTLRSDALIVTSSEITALSLPTMLYADVTERMPQLPRLVRGRRSTYAARNRALGQTLLWLWEVAVGPVCETLGLAPTASVQLPRLCWIGVGALANAPFHAAGDHAAGSTRNTLSRAVSSYIATIKALSYARQTDLNLDADSRLLLVTMSRTPDTPATPSTPTIKWGALTGAAAEADEIAAVVAHTTRFDSPTTAAVLAALPDYQVIHFACHGVSDSVQPSNSYLLLLASDAADPATARFTVKDVAQMTTQTAQVAYLSACSTADNAAVRLADEVIHIATGFQLAGFGHVLATLWQGGDECCKRVAGEFYRLLFGGSGKTKGGHRVVSEAFHGAVVALRDEYREQPVKWASFIHTGA